MRSHNNQLITAIPWPTKRIARLAIVVAGMLIFPGLVAEIPQLAIAATFAQLRVAQATDPQVQENTPAPEQNASEERLVIESDYGASIDDINQRVVFPGFVTFEAPDWQLTSGTAEARYVTRDNNRVLNKILASKGVTMQWQDLMGEITALSVDIRPGYIRLSPMPPPAATAREHFFTWRWQENELHHIGAVEMFADEAKLQITDNVVFTNPVRAIIVRADKITINIDPATRQPQKLQAEGAIHLNWQEHYLRSDRLLYNPVEEVIELCGNTVWLWHEITVAANCVLLDLIAATIATDDQIYSEINLQQQLNISE